MTVPLEPDAVSTIIDGIFQINGRLGDIHDEVLAIRRLMEEEDDGEEDDEDE